MLKYKKAQVSSGLIIGIIMGIAGLIIAVIIAFIIVNTLTTADLLTDGRNTTTVVNESGANINASGHQLLGLETWYIPGTITITLVVNDTAAAELIEAANYTVNAYGNVQNATANAEEIMDDTNISYTYDVYSNSEQSSKRLEGNFTKGIDNVSSKLPTVLLIAAIVLLLGILALLVFAWQRMRVGGGGSI